jgi:cell division septum initiation protein DivIVA
MESALEKAQEVMNDQYVIIHDLQLQVNAVLEGVRILNERVEEYDKRIENLQTSTDKFFTEVQAENGRQNTILCQTLDKMHDKLTSEMASKLGEKPPSSPVSAQFGSPRVDPPRTGFAPPSPTNINIAGQLETQAKAILDLQAHFQKIHPQLINQQRAMSQLAHLPASVQKFCDEVSARIRTYQADQNAFTTQVKALDVNLQGLGMSVNQHISDADHNFAETAIHMDTVKKRFAEHRKQLDNLITAWRDTLTTIEQLSSKYEFLKEFLSTKMVPTIVQVQKAFPELFVASADDTTNRNMNTEATTQNRLLPAATDGDRNVLMSGRGNGGGGAFNPIEL